MKIEERKVEVGGLQTRYLTAGEGPPLLLLHALGENALDWQWVLPNLASTRRVYAPDFPGFGGSAKPGTLVPAVRFADEYNTFGADVDACRERRARVVEACEQAGRDPATLPFSLMTTFLVGSDRADLERRARRLAERIGAGGDGARLLREAPAAWIVGTVEEVVERLRELEQAGVERIFLQHLVHEDVETVELVGAEVVPAVV